MYYKVICGNRVVDALDKLRWVRFLSKFDEVVITDISSAQGFYGSDKKTIYVKEGFDCPPGKKYKKARLQQIDEEEYNSLISQITAGSRIAASKTAIAEEQALKISQLSQDCNQKISKGVSLKLSDGRIHNFSLSIEDQLNIRSLYEDIQSGDDFVIYHDNNRVCQKFSADDFKLIVKASRDLIKYHTTYFNLLKNYVKTLQDSEKISGIYYGVDLLDLDDSELVKDLMREVSL